MIRRILSVKMDGAKCPRCGSEEVRITDYDTVLKAECEWCAYGDSRSTGDNIGVKGHSEKQVLARLRGLYLDKAFQTPITEGSNESKI
jgi:Zn ribbon nucleic-acid-binding protein